MKSLRIAARRVLPIIVFAVHLRAGGAATVAVTSQPAENGKVVSAAQVPPADRRTIQQYGLTFVLARSSRSDSTETEEYFIQGESAESWSQMITYQRLVLPDPIGADHYVLWLKKHFEQTPGGPRLKIVQQGKVSSIFGVQYAKSEKSGEQFELVLVSVADPRRPNELHLVQYSINPERVSLEEMELQVKRWQTLFQSQAASISH